MKRKVLWLTIALVLFDIGFVTNARATRRTAAAHQCRMAAKLQPPALRAQQFYPIMAVTVLRPVQLPDQVIGAGEYTFRLINNGQSVAITTTDGDVVGTYVVVPAYRRHAVDGLVNTEDAPDRNSDRIDSWFFAGQQDGYSFVYSGS